MSVECCVVEGDGETTQDVTKTPFTSEAGRSGCVWQRVQLTGVGNLDFRKSVCRTLRVMLVLLRDNFSHFSAKTT